MDFATIWGRYAKSYKHYYNAHSFIMWFVSICTILSVAAMLWQNAEQGTIWTYPGRTSFANTHLVLGIILTGLVFLITIGGQILWLKIVAKDYFGIGIKLPYFRLIHFFSGFIMWIFARVLMFGGKNLMYDLYLSYYDIYNFYGKIWYWETPFVCLIMVL